MEPVTRDAIVARLAGVAPVVELAIGERTEVAEALVETGVDVTAIDINQRTVPEGVTFVQDDLTDPTLPIYRDADVLFAQNFPEELQRSARNLAESIGATFYFTTLGTEEPVIPVVRETLPGETLFRAISGP